MLAIKNNIMAGNAARHLGKAYDSLATSVERLASGLRINSAKDDAAGLAVRELIRADIAVLQQGSRNASDGISMLQTMEGAMAVIDDSLIRMKELAEQAATGSYSSAQRVIMNAEFAEMANEIDRIAGATAFNGISMLNSSTGSVTIHVGTTSTIDIDKVNMTKSALGVGAGGAEVISTHGVATASTAFLTVNNTDDALQSDALVLRVAFSDADGDSEQTVDVYFSDAAAAGATSYTLQEVVDKINTATQNINVNDSTGNSLNYSAASAYYNTTAGEYRLKIQSKETSLTDTVALTATGKTDGVDLTGWVDRTADFSSGISLINGGDVAAFDAVATGSGVNILTTTAATTALTTLTTAINTKDAARATFGYKMNRLESTISILDIQSENLMSAESRVSDVDVATEMATLTRTQVLSQAGISMLAQANQMPQMALSLLR